MKKGSTQAPGFRADGMLAAVALGAHALPALHSLIPRQPAVTVEIGHIEPAIGRVRCLLDGNPAVAIAVGHFEHPASKAQASRSMVEPGQAALLPNHSDLLELLPVDDAVTVAIDPVERGHAISTALSIAQGSGLAAKPRPRTKAAPVRTNFFACKMAVAIDIKPCE